MLGVKNYSQDHVDACRASVREQVAAYEGVTTAARDLAGNDGARLDAAIGAFEPRFFNNLVVVLDAFFMHRLRGVEGKDGNPANEVRLVAASVTTNDARLVPDNQIRLTPDSSVLGLATGDEIRLTADDFTRLADGFFAEIEKRFVA